MIYVYTANTPNGIKIPIALEELGLPYRVVKLDLGLKEQKSDRFLRINPNGRIPAIVDDEVQDEHGNPQTVFESGAILLYLAEKVGRLRGDSPAEQVAVMEWLFFQVGGVGPMFGQASYFKNSEEYPSENAVARFTAGVGRLASVLESRLQSSRFLAGENYSIADIANYGWLRDAESFGLELSEHPAIAAWLDRVESRLAVRRGLARTDAPDQLFSAEPYALVEQRLVG